MLFTDLVQGTLDSARQKFRERLVRRGFPQHFVEGDAEEAFAQATLELWVLAERGEPIYNPTGWLLTCAWRRAINRVVSEKTHPQCGGEDLDWAIDSRLGPPEELLAEEERREVRQALRNLILEERTVVWMLYFEELSVREVAVRLDWSPTRVMRRKNSGAQKLRTRLR